jgi:hypothetical protein
METADIRRRIEVALGKDYDEATRHDIAFHMTDWIEDLRALVDIFENPERATDEKVTSTLMLFLVHAPAHIAAAAKLYTGEPVRDVFKVGAVDGQPRPEP